MSKGSKFIHELISVIEKKEQQAKQPYSQAKSNISEVSPPQTKNAAKAQQIVVRLKQKNFFRRIYQLSPSLQQSHIFRLYGFMGINEKALENPDCSESLVYTHFQSRVIERIEAYDHAIVVELTEPTIPFNQPSVEYIIEKYKSKGDTYFYQLATMIQELCQVLKLSQQNPHPQQKIQSVKKWLDILGDQMYVCSMGSRKFAISKSLLSYLQYDLNQFAIQAIKYRASFTEFFSAINYGNLVKHLLSCLKYIAKYSCEQISLSDFRQLTTYNFCDFIQSKNHVRSYCDMTISLLNPSFLCHKINFIYYKEGQQLKREPNAELCLAIQEEKDRIRQGEYKTIDRVKPVPRHLLKQNQKLFANYQNIEIETQENGTERKKA